MWREHRTDVPMKQNILMDLAASHRMRSAIVLGIRRYVNEIDI